MKVKKVNSSFIKGLSHSNGMLKVDMEGGNQYVYIGVPFQVFWGLWQSESKGKFFNSKIKGKYSYIHIEKNEFNAYIN